MSSIIDRFTLCISDSNGGQENLYLLSGVQNYRRSIEDGQQKYGNEICKIAGGEGTHRNEAYHCGAPRRVASRREPDVQDSADQAGGGCFPQAANFQLRQKK